MRAELRNWKWVFPLFINILSHVRSEAFPTDIRRESQVRQLDLDPNFANLDEILKQSTIYIHETVIEDLPFPLPLRSVLTLKRLTCQFLGLDDIQDDFSSPSRFRSNAALMVRGLDLNCGFDWEYFGGGGIVSGGDEVGTGQIATENNMWDATFRIIKRRLTWEPSADMSKNTVAVAVAVAVADGDNTIIEAYPPNALSLRRCRLNLNFQFMNFEGGTRATVLNTLDNIVEQAFQNEFRQILCDRVESFAKTNFTQYLEQIIDTINPYLEMNRDDMTAIFNQQESQIQSFVNLVDFTDNDQFYSRMFTQGSDILNDLFGDNTINSNEPPKINSYLETNFLDSNGTWYFEPEQLDLPSIFQTRVPGFSQNLQTNEASPIDIKAQLQQIRIIGVNTFTKFQLLQFRGPQMFQNIINHQGLLFEADISLSLKSISNESDNVQISLPEINELLTVKFSLDGIKADISIFTALDKQKFNTFQIGSLLDMNNLLPCIASTILHSNLNDTFITLDNYSLPSLNGLISQGIDTIIDNLVQNIASLYDPMLEVPVFERYLSVQLHNWTNMKIKERIDNEIKELTCPPYIWSNENPRFLDFRNIFFDSNSTLEVGVAATNVNPFGDIADMNQIIRSVLINMGDNGSPQINENLISPFTKTQSNIEGTLAFNQTISITKLPISLLGDDSTMYNLFISNIKIENLDSLAEPMDLFRPHLDDPYAIDNSFVMGTNSKPLRGSFNLFVSDNNEENKSNEIRLQAEFKNLFVATSILAKIDQQLLMELTIHDLSSMDCLIATLPALLLNDKGLGILNSNYPSAAIRNLDILMEDKLSLSIECVECSNDGLKELPNIFSFLNEAEITDKLFKRLLATAKQLMDVFDIQFMIDRQIQEAHMRCPRLSSSLSNNKLTGYDFKRNKAVSREVVELILFSCTILVQVGMVVLPGIIEVGKNSLEDISAQINVTDGSSDLVDLRRNQSSYSTIVNTGLDIIYRAFIKTRPDPSSPNGETLGINTLLVDQLLDDIGSYSLNLPDLSLTLSGISASIDSVKFTGLNSFNRFDAFNVTAPNSIKTAFGMDKVTVELVASITSSDTSPLEKFLFQRADMDSVNSVQKLMLEIEIQGIDANLDITVALNKTKLDQIELGSMLYSDSVIQCLFSTVDKIELTDLVVSIKNYSITEPSNIISNIVWEDILKSNEVIFSEYEMIPQQVIEVFFNQLVRTQLNKMIKERILSTGCSDRNATIDSDYVDFRDLFLDPAVASSAGATGLSPYGDVVSTMASFFNNDLATPDENGVVRMNQFIPETITLPRDIISLSQALNLTADIDDVVSFRVHNLTISNADSIRHPLALLSPQLDDPYILDNSFLLGLSNEPITISFEIVQSLSGDTANMRNELEIYVELTDIVFEASLTARVSSKALMEFPIRNMNNWNCWLATLSPHALNAFDIDNNEKQPTLKLNSLDMKLHAKKISVRCVFCTSTELEELANTLSSLDEDSPLNDCTSKTLNYIKESLMNNLTQTRMDRWLLGAAGKCPHGGASIDFQPFSIPDVENDTLKTTIILVLLGIFLVVGIYAREFYVRGVARKNHQLWLDRLSNVELQQLLSWHNSRERESLALNKHTKSLFESEHVPTSVSYLVPCIILLNIGLFLSGHLNLGGTIIANLQFAGEDIFIPNLFQFSVAQAVVDMWTIGIKILAVIIFILSIMWPYIKQLTTLVSWIMPPSRMSLQRRGGVLYQLDSLGKWSIIDIYILMLSLVCFRVLVKSPSNHNLLPDNFYSFSLMLLPVWGLYANMIAQLISQISSHFIIYYHEKVARMGNNLLEKKRSTQGLPLELDIHSKGNVSSIHSQHTMEMIVANTLQEPPKKIALYNEPFYLGGLKTGTEVRLHLKGRICVAVTGVIGLLLLLIGCFASTFRIEIVGLASQLIEIGNDSATTYFNVFSIVGTVIDQANYHDTVSTYIGLIFLSLLFLVTTIVTPFILVISLLCVWFLPMLSNVRKRLLEAINILKAWQFLEVFIISVFLAMWQVGDASELMVEDTCKSLDVLFNSLVVLGIINEEDARCFYANVELQTGFFVLCCCSLTIQWLAYFTNEAIEQKNGDFFIAKSVNEDDTISQKSEKNSLKEFKELDQKKIQPVDIHFSDRFSWFLQSSEISPASLNKPNMSQNSSSDYTNSDKSIITPIESTPIKSAIGFNPTIAEDFANVEVALSIEK